jgi:hypothetical protein
MTEVLQAYLDTGLHAVAPLRNRVGRLLKRRWMTPVTICAGTGLLGVLSGFALFILLWREPDTSLWRWVAILSCAAALSFIFEHLRAERIEQEEASAEIFASYDYARSEKS